MNAGLDSVDGDVFAAGGANVNAGLDSVSAGFAVGVAAKLNAGLGLRRCGCFLQIFIQRLLGRGVALLRFGQEICAKAHRRCRRFC